MKRRTPISDRQNAIRPGLRVTLRELPPNEARSHLRLPVRKRVWCEQSKSTLFAPALNVCPQGLFVKAPNYAEVGEEVRITFPDIEGDEVIALARIAWVEGATKASRERRNHESDYRTTRSSDVFLRPQSSPSRATGFGLRIERFERGVERFVHFLVDPMADASRYAAVSDLEESGCHADQIPNPWGLPTC